MHTSQSTSLPSKLMASSLQPSWLSSFDTISPSRHCLFTSTNLYKTYPFKQFKLSSSLKSSDSESPEPTSRNSPETLPKSAPAPVDPVKLAFERAKAYKKLVQPNSNLKVEKNPVKDSDGNENGNDKSSLSSSAGAVNRKTENVPAAVKIATDKANKGVVDDGKTSNTKSGFEGVNSQNLGNGGLKKKVEKKGELSISSIDFMGLGFADKKKMRGLPAGLVPVADPFPVGDLPEVEIIVGDISNFDGKTTSKSDLTQEADSDLYKPKVSSWGVFPRPGDISKTFGGGKTIRPGDVLETAEEKAAKEARTRELLAAYKAQIGLNIDPKLKSECEEALKEGDSLMNAGKLREALPYYEKVMDKLTFKSKLHGLAALQWSICQDSLSRPNEARQMYERLQSHPNPQVSKKARQFMFSFQAMEMMKFTSSPFSLKNTGYQNYFEAFIEKKANYTGDETEEGTMSQALPYILFLVSPILLVLIIAVQKRIM